jgi:nucleotide-binding universal stress UspA family protein
LYEKILVPVDELDDCNSALLEAIKLAKMSGGKITVIHVHPKWSTFIVDSKEALPEKLKKEAANILVKAEKQARTEGFEVETLLLDGDPVQQIVKTANDKHFDLIAMGARRKSNLKELILGSVSSGVLKNASCPVLITKCFG